MSTSALNKHLARSVLVALVVVVASTRRFAFSFVANSFSNVARRRRIASTNLYYTEEPDSVRQQQQQQQGAAPRHRRLAIPILGPFMRRPPLVVGDEMKLDAPTPMQWQVLQESAIVHAERTNQTESEDEEVTTIDGAPIVAVVDHVTSQSNVEAEYGTGMPSGQYATLAAVVGVSSGGTTEFVEGSVRLVGIGRAVLGKYYYKTPSEQRTDATAEEEDYDDLDDEDDYEDDDDDDDSYSLDDVPIVMAEFDLLHDTGVVGYHDWKFGKKSKKTSPVHALHLLNKAANRVGRIHEGRLRIVAGLKAAKARLDRVANEKKEEEELEDYDGLGILSSYDDDDYYSDTEAEEDRVPPVEEMSIDDFLASFQGLSSSSSSSPSLAESDNYGLKFYSAFSTLSRLTDEAMIALDPYYSPAFKEREEYWYEMMSFVVWRALEGFADSEEISEALKCRNTVERLESACDVMSRHLRSLENLAEEASRELRDCGEECTDLW